MLDIDEMSSKEIHELLEQVGYGHLGCIHEGKPYVVPMFYYLQDSDIYLFTTIGMKTHDFDANPEICLQVEEIHNPLHWRSAIVTGRVKRLTVKEDIDIAGICYMVLPLGWYWTKPDHSSNSHTG
jgi:uncharacterized protein